MIPSTLTDLVHIWTMEKSLNSYTLSDIRIITTINYSQRRGNEWRRSRISRPLSLLGVSLLTWPRPVAFALGLCTGRLLIGPLLSTLRFLLWLMVCLLSLSCLWLLFTLGLLLFPALLLNSFLLPFSCPVTWTLMASKRFSRALSCSRWTLSLANSSSIKCMSITWSKQKGR